MIVVIAGCSGIPLPASVRDGECKVFERPEFVVRGAKRYDQNWIDGNIEAGVGGCNWARPKPRPASFDAAGNTVAPVADPTPRAPRRSGIWLRTKERVKKIIPHRTPGTVSPVVAAPAPGPNPLAAPINGTPATFDPPATTPVPVPVKRRSIDELLSPRK
jgi:hypothetical protein